MPRCRSFIYSDAEKYLPSVVLLPLSHSARNPRAILGSVTKTLSRFERDSTYPCGADRDAVSESTKKPWLFWRDRFLIKIHSPSKCLKGTSIFFFPPFTFTEVSILKTEQVYLWKALFGLYLVCIGALKDPNNNDVNLQKSVYCLAENSISFKASVTDVNSASDYVQREILEN